MAIFSEFYFTSCCRRCQLPVPNSSGLTLPTLVATDLNNLKLTPLCSVRSQVTVSINCRLSMLLTFAVVKVCLSTIIKSSTFAALARRVCRSGDRRGGAAPTVPKWDGDRRRRRRQRHSA